MAVCNAAGARPSRWLQAVAFTVRGRDRDDPPVARPARRAADPRRGDPRIADERGRAHGLAGRREERRLEHTYGAPYVAYCQDVPRWWPRIGTPATPCPHRGLRRALLVELQGPLIMAPAALKTLHVVLFGWLHAMHLR